MNFPNKPLNDYLLNCVEVLIPDQVVAAGITKYEDKDKLNELRNQYRNTHYLVRRGDNIINVPFSLNGKVFGELTQIFLKDDLNLTAGLVRNTVVMYLVGQGRKINSFDPISFLSEHKTDNLLQNSFPSNLKCPDWLSIQVQPEITVKPVRFANGRNIIVMAFNFRAKFLIKENVTGLLRNNIDIVGKYISREKNTNDEKLGKKFEIVGRAEKISNGIIDLTDQKEYQNVQINSEEAYIENRKENLYQCLEILFPREFQAIKNNLSNELAKFRSGPNRIARFTNLASFFSRTRLEICPNIMVKVSSLLDQKSSNFPRVDSLPKPTYVFDPSRQRTHYSHDKGLDAHGPYDRATFSSPTPKVAIICQASKKGQVEQFITKFCEGLPNITNAKGIAPFGKGFVRKYCTNKWEIEFFLTNSSSADSYSKTALEVIESAAISGKKWNLVMIQIEDKFKTLSPDLNPYLVTKASFLSHGLVTQDFTIETISKPDRQLAYSLNQMALATYAKLGGTPWLLSATPSVSHELIFGLGSAQISSSRFGLKERIVGITTVFKGDGDYVLENRSKAVSFEEYPQQLQASLRSTYNILKQRYNWQSGESIRFIFHSFKEFKNTEVDAVKSLMAEIARDFKLEYAFVHVIDNHPFFLIDRNQAGMKDFESGKIKGVNAPTRGQMIALNNYECLVTLTGAMEVKKADDGLPSPLLLRLHRGSSFTDMTYLSRQLYSLSNHSWRTFMPSSMPITISYSEIIARLLGELAHVQKWNPESMVGPIGSSRWFL